MNGQINKSIEDKNTKGWSERCRLVNVIVLLSIVFLLAPHTRAAEGNEDPKDSGKEAEQSSGCICKTTQVLSQKTDAAVPEINNNEEAKSTAKPCTNSAKNENISIARLMQTKAITASILNMTANISKTKQSPITLKIPAYNYTAVLQELQTNKAMFLRNGTAIPKNARVVFQLESIQEGLQQTVYFN